MCAYIDFKATTGKQDKGKQFHKSLNGSAKNGKMAMNLESWLGGLSKKMHHARRFYFKLKS